jgi:hypothetical protein
LANLKERQFEKLARGFLSKAITFREHPTKGGRPNLKSMYKFTRLLKWETVIRNEIMIHFGHRKPTANNQKPYSNDEWHMLKDKHKLDKMLFSTLDSELNDDFYSKKLRLDPSNEAPHAGFKRALEKWIQSGTVEDNQAEAILLDIHYKYDKVENMAGLLDVINKESCTFFLMDDAMRTITVVYTTHSTQNILTIWKGPN